MARSVKKKYSIYQAPVGLDLQKPDRHSCLSYPLSGFSCNSVSLRTRPTNFVGCGDPTACFNFVSGAPLIYFIWRESETPTLQSAISKLRRLFHILKQSGFLWNQYLSVIQRDSSPINSQSSGAHGLRLGSLWNVILELICLKGAEIVIKGWSAFPFPKPGLSSRLRLRVVNFKPNMPRF